MKIKFIKTNPIIITVAFIVIILAVVSIFKAPEIKNFAQKEIVYVDSIVYDTIQVFDTLYVAVPDSREVTVTPAKEKEDGGMSTGEVIFLIIFSSVLIFIFIVMAVSLLY